MFILAFFLKNIYIFIWLCQVLVAACEFFYLCFVPGLSCSTWVLLSWSWQVRSFSCSVWTLSCGMWDLVPHPTRDGTPAPCIGNVVFATGPSGKSHISFLHDSKKLETSEKSNNLRTDKHNNGIIEYYLPNERDKLLHMSMKLINIRLSERSHRQKRNAVIIPFVWNSKPGKVICSEGNLNRCCLGEELLEWAWRRYWRWLGCSVCICQNALKSVLKMGMFIYYILVLFLASSGLSCCTWELCWGMQAQ